MKLVNGFILLFISFTSFAQEVVTCRNPSGEAYYHNHGLVSRADAGWHKDKITDGLITLQKLNDGKFDILIVDAKKSILSLRQDGGEIYLIRRGKEDATFLHVFPGRAIEIYTFYRDRDGVNRFELLQSKGGDHLRIHKSSVMTGQCKSIDFSLINQ